MTDPARQRFPSAVAEGWTVDIPMPLNRKRQPVGWLSLNDRRHWSSRSKVTKAWRDAAAAAYERAALPKDLGRIYVEVVFRFPDLIRRDPDNYSATVKPTIDALQPRKVRHVQNKKTGKLEVRVDAGWGVIPADDPRYVVRGPEQPVGEPLGRDNPCKGVITVRIIPLPPEGAS